MIDKLKDFSSKCKLQNAIRLFFVNYFDIKKEKKELLNIFKEIDLDGNGMISKDEL